MLKSIAPLWGKLQHLPRPLLFTHHESAPAEGDEGDKGDNVSAGQRLAEQVAGAVGSWGFIGAQATIMALWVLLNTLTFTGALHFDEYPFVFLNLAMSAEAAFTGPVLLIAANFGAMRDHQQSDRIERLGSQNERLTEQNEALTRRLVKMEQLLDQHVAQSLKAHTEQLSDLGVLLREMHTVICAQPGAVQAAPVAAPTVEASLAAAPTRSARQRARGAANGGEAGA